MKKDSNPYFIYFLRMNIPCLSCNNSYGLIKIGKSKDIEVRENRLKVLVPFEFEILGVMIGKREDEKRIQRFFFEESKGWKGGEWFTQSDRLMKFIGDNTKSLEEVEEDIRDGFSGSDFYNNIRSMYDSKGPHQHSEIQEKIANIRGILDCGAYSIILLWKKRGWIKREKIRKGEFMIEFVREIRDIKKETATIPEQIEESIKSIPITEEWLEVATTKDLKEAAKKFGVGTSGLKADIINRFREINGLKPIEVRKMKRGRKKFFP